MLTSTVQVVAMLAGIVLAAGIAPSVRAASINGNSYSDMADNNCTSVGNVTECLIDFAPTPLTTATVKVQNLSCIWEGSGNTGMKSVVFKVVNSKGVVLAERIITKSERGDAATTGALNVAIANTHVSMTVPKGGRPRVSFLPAFLGTMSAKCTIVGLYN